MSDELVWPDDSDDKIQKRPWWAPCVRLIVPLGMIAVLTCMSLVSSVWQDSQMQGVLDAAQARREAQLPAGYYGETREVRANVRDVEIGIVQSVVHFESKELLEVVIDNGLSRPVIDWVTAREDLKVGDKCLMKWVDGVSCRERGAFKIENGKKKKEGG